MSPAPGPSGLSRRRGPLVVLTIATAMAGGCGTAGSSSASDRTEIEAVTRRWETSLVEGRPDEAVVDVFTADAVRLPSGEPAVRGHELIALALAGSSPLEEASFAIEDLEVDGDLAFANGTYRVRAPGGGALSGKFLEVWKRTTAGWRIHRVMWD